MKNYKSSLIFFAAMAATTSYSAQLNVATPWVTDSSVKAVTRDGNGVVGSYRNASNVWIGGYWNGAIFSNSNDQYGSEFTGVSANGNRAIGYRYTAANYGQSRLLIMDTGVLTTKNAFGGDSTRGLDVSNDGSMIVGHATLPSGERRGFRYTDAGGFVQFGVPTGGIESMATGVNANGTKVVGYSKLSTGVNRAWTWTQGGTMSYMGMPVGYNSNNFETYANAISGNGEVIVGSMDNGGDSRAFRWTANSGFVDLGSLAGEVYSIATEVSDDGNFVCGYYWYVRNGTERFRTFIWDPVNGKRDVESVLFLQGVNTSGWELSLANDITYSNGVATIVGQGKYNGVSKGFSAKIDIAGSLENVTNFTVEQGVLLGGGVASTITPNDGNSIMVLSDEFNSDSEIEFESDVEYSAASSVQYRFRTHASRPNIIALYHGFNFQSQNYEFLGAQELPAGAFNATLVANAGTKPVSMGQVKSMVRFAPAESYLDAPDWVCGIDHMQFFVTP